MSAADDCPACGAYKCPTERRPVRGEAALVAVGPCPACNWCEHDRSEHRCRKADGTCRHCGGVALRANAWHRPEHLPRPADMADEEFGFRAALFGVWAHRPASELVSQFRIFADWLDDRGDAEAAAARADWTPYLRKRRDPPGCMDWLVPVGAGWHEVRTESAAPHGRYVYSVGFPTGALHNSRWLLCWPPGFVRFTRPHAPDFTRWRVTAMAERNLTYSGAIDYLPIFHPKEAVIRRTPGLAKAESADLGLFAEDAA